MKSRILMMCVISVLGISLAGCGANDSEDDDYASYSQDIEDTSIDETNINTTITTQSSETTSQITTSVDISSDTTITLDTTTEESTTIVSTVTSAKSTSVATTITTTKSTTAKTESQEQNNQIVEQSSDSQDNYAQPVVSNIPVENIAYFDSSDMYFSSNNGYSFTIDMSIEEIISNLGDNYILESAPSCYYNGDDRIYTYDDFAIYTYTLDGTNYYSQEIELLNSNVSTTKGIKIGSSLSDVESAYGTNYQVVGYEYRFYASDNTYLYFLIFDGIVDSLGYYIEILL